jgi:hypothetical protein
MLWLIVVRTKNGIQGGVPIAAFVDTDIVCLVLPTGNDQDLRTLK